MSRLRGMGLIAGSRGAIGFKRSPAACSPLMDRNGRFNDNIAQKYYNYGKSSWFLSFLAIFNKETVFIYSKLLCDSCMRKSLHLTLSVVRKTIIDYDFGQAHFLDSTNDLGDDQGKHSARACS
jgi:hypothetical protein